MTVRPIPDTTDDYLAGFAAGIEAAAAVLDDNATKAIRLDPQAPTGYAIRENAKVIRGVKNPLPPPPAWLKKIWR